MSNTSNQVNEMSNQENLEELIEFKSPNDTLSNSTNSTTSALANHMREVDLDMEGEEGKSGAPPTQCPICYVDFNTYDHRPILTPCFHVICSVSLTKLRKAECPTCRSALPADFRRDGVLPVHSGIMSILTQSSSSSMAPRLRSSSLPPRSSSSAPREHKEQESKSDNNNQVPRATAFSNHISSLPSVRAPRVDGFRREREQVDKLIVDAGFASYGALTRYIERYYRAEQALIALDIQKQALQEIVDEVGPHIPRLESLYQTAKASRQVSRAPKRQRSNNGNARDVGENLD